MARSGCQAHDSRRRRRVILGLACVVCVALATLSASSPGAQEAPPRPATGASFFDDFSRIDRKRWYVSHGWNNGPNHGCGWSASNNRITPPHGVNQILDDHANAGRPYSCGELQSMEFYGYGTYEVRLRSIDASGVVTGFFVYTGPPHGAGKRHDEIDFEFMGRSPGQVQLNYFAAGQGGHERNIDLGFNASTTINDYAFQWTPDAIRWFVNGKLVHEVKRKDGEQWPFEPGKIYLSIFTAIGMEGWTGPFRYPGHPLVATYEHVAFTALGEPCAFPASVVCGAGR